MPCSAVGLQRFGRGTQMQASLDALLLWGWAFLGDGLACRREGRYEEDVSRTKEKSQDRAERMGNVFLDGKKIFCCWETEAE